MKNYLNESFRLLIKSLKEVKSNILLMMLIDAIPYLVLIFGAIIALKHLNAIAVGIDMPSDLLAMGLEESEAFLSNIKVLFYSLIIYPILLILIGIAAWSFSKGTIYSMLLKKKFTWRYYYKFLLLNLIWIIPWQILAIILLFIIKPTAIIFVIIIIPLLWLHFTVSLCVLFTQENKFNKIKKALSLGIKKIHLFILPYLIVLALFILFLLLSYAYLLLPQAIAIILIAATFLFFAAFSRIYLTNIVNSVSKKEV